jgi:hypothetical protein
VWNLSGFIEIAWDKKRYLCRLEKLVPPLAKTSRRGREAEEPIDGEPCGAIKPAQLRTQALAGSAKPCGAIKPAQLRTQALAGSAKRAFEGED